MLRRNREHVHHPLFAGFTEYTHITQMRASMKFNITDANINTGVQEVANQLAYSTTEPDDGPLATPNDCRSGPSEELYHSKEQIKAQRPFKSALHSCSPAAILPTLALADPRTAWNARCLCTSDSASGSWNTGPYWKPREGRSPRLKHRQSGRCIVIAACARDSAGIDWGAR